MQGILNVSTTDKSTGKSNRIMITSDKGCLSKELEHMVNEAKKYKKEDEGAAVCIQSNNGLESYAYNLCNSLNNDKLKDKQEVSKEEYEEKQKELEVIANPIMQKLYSATGAQ